MRMLGCISVISFRCRRITSRIALLAIIALQISLETSRIFCCVTRSFVRRLVVLDCYCFLPVIWALSSRGDGPVGCGQSPVWRRGRVPRSRWLRVASDESRPRLPFARVNDNPKPYIYLNPALPGGPQTLARWPNLVHAGPHGRVKNKYKRKFPEIVNERSWRVSLHSLSTLHNKKQVIKIRGWIVVQSSCIVVSFCVNFSHYTHVAACRGMSWHVAACRHMSLHVVACRRMSSHIVACHGMSSHVIACRPMSLHVIACHHTSSHVAACRRMSSHVACRRMSSHVVACHRMSPHVTACRRMSSHVVACCHMSWHVTACRGMSPHVVACCCMSHIVTRRRMSWHVVTCRHMSSHVVACRRMSRHVVTCRCMSSHVVTCRHMSSHVTACLRMSRHVITCRCMSSHVVARRRTSSHVATKENVWCSDHQVAPLFYDLFYGQFPEIYYWV